MMGKILIFLILCKALHGALIPAPFITEPEVIQRAGYSFTEEYFDVKLFNNPYGIAFTNLRNTSPQGELMVSSDCAWHRLIYVYLEEDGGQSAEWIKIYGAFGNGAGQFDAPMGICIDTTIYNGVSDEYTIYAADKCNNRVVKLKYDVSEEEISYVGTIGSSLSNPTDVASVTKDNGAGAYVVIIEQGNDRLSLYETSANGSSSLIQRYGTQGPGTGQFNAPQGIAICKIITEPGAYYIYVADKGNNRIVCLHFQPGQGITWVRDYKKMGNCGFYSVTTSQYYCVYATAFFENKVYVFTQGLTELLYEYGNSTLLNGPKDVYIDWDRIGLTENWTANTGIQYFEIIPEIREFYPVPDTFDATTDSVMIHFRVDETAQLLTMKVADTTVFVNQYYSPNTYWVTWDGRCAGGMVAVPGPYEMQMYCDTFLLVDTSGTVDGTAVAGNAHGHWTPEGNPYVLVGNCQVPINDSLIIDHDVLVMGHGSGAGITANGPIKTLISLGDSVLFTSHRKLYPVPDTTYPGMWSGLTIKNPQSQLRYCRFEYGGTAINIQPTTVASNNIAECLIKDNTTAGACWFTGAGGFGDSIAYVNNTSNKIEVTPCSLKYDMTIQKQMIPYWFKKTSARKNYEVYGDDDYYSTLTIEPGTVIEFDDSTVLRIGRPSYWDPYQLRWFPFRGRLICQGTESDTIILTLKDGQSLRRSGTTEAISDAVGNNGIATATASPRNDKNSGLSNEYESRITNTNGEIALSKDLETGSPSVRNDNVGDVADNSENSLYWRGLRFEGYDV